MKVIGIGMNKTGTTTLGVCLETLGFSHTSHNLEMLQYVREGKLSPVFDYVRDYDALEDWPWPLIYEELDQAFPGSRFVLTTRTTVDLWYASLVRHAERTGPTEMRRLVYGYSMPTDNENAHRAMYEAHNEATRRYFADRPRDFLEVCWETGDGWDELCGFLDRATPDIPFPHLNRSRAHRRRSLVSVKRLAERFRDGRTAKTTDPP